MDLTLLAPKTTDFGLRREAKRHAALGRNQLNYNFFFASSDT
jgi:hypothetical protein